MRTSRIARQIPAILSVAAITGIVLVGIGLRGDSGLGAGALPLDAASEGFVVSATDSEGKISEDAAWAAVEAEFGSFYDSGKRSSYLVHVDSSTTDIQNRDVWMFEVTGLSIVGSVPYGAEVSNAPYTGATIVVDASTGEWLGSMWH